jgi:hypothetical protein
MLKEILSLGTPSGQPNCAFFLSAIQDDLRPVSFASLAISENAE